MYQNPILFALTATCLITLIAGCDAPVSNAPPPPSYDYYGPLGDGAYDPSLDSLTPLSDSYEQWNRDQEMIQQQFLDQAIPAAEPVQLEPLEPVQLQPEYAVPY